MEIGFLRNMAVYGRLEMSIPVGPRTVMGIGLGLPTMAGAGLIMLLGDGHPSTMETGFGIRAITDGVGFRGLVSDHCYGIRRLSVSSASGGVAGSESALALAVALEALGGYR